MGFSLTLFILYRSQISAYGFFFIIILKIPQRGAVNLELCTVSVTDFSFYFICFII